MKTINREQCKKLAETNEGEEPSMVAVVRCEQHSDDPGYWVFWIDDFEWEHYGADTERVADAVCDEFGFNDGHCLDIGVEIVSAGDFLAGRKGAEYDFSMPLGDRTVDCENPDCGREYAVRNPGVDPCPFCGAIPGQEAETGMSEEELKKKFGYEARPSINERSTYTMEEMESREFRERVETFKAAVLRAATALDQDRGVLWQALHEVALGLLEADKGKEHADQYVRALKAYEEWSFKKGLAPGQDRRR